MKDQQKREKKVNLPLRHSASVKTTLDEMAYKENLEPSVFYRQIFNAGIESKLGLKVENNQIIS